MRSVSEDRLSGCWPARMLPCDSVRACTHSFMAVATLQQALDIMQEQACWRCIAQACHVKTSRTHAVRMLLTRACNRGWSIL